MPRTLQHIIDHADELAALAEQAEPEGDGHRGAIGNLRAAVVASAQADQAVADAVAAGRADGMSWTAIGLIVGTSGEAARKRYGAHVPA